MKVTPAESVAAAGAASIAVHCALPKPSSQLGMAGDRKGRQRLHAELVKQSIVAHVFRGETYAIKGTCADNWHASVFVTLANHLLAQISWPNPDLSHPPNHFP